MKALAQEYGFIIITIVCVGFFFFLFSYAFMRNVRDLDGDGVNDSTLIGFTYRQDSVKLEGFEAVSELDQKNAPHFKSVSGSSNYKIGTSELTRDMITNLIKAYADEGETVNLTDEMTILVYRYSYIRTYIDSDGNPMVNGMVMTEEVPARDKYGNLIKNDDGSYVTTTQPKYEVEFLGELTDTNSFPIDSDTAKFKIVCRVTNNSVKSEITKFIIKEQ